MCTGASQDFLPPRFTEARFTEGAHATRALFYYIYMTHPDFQNRPRGGHPRASQDHARGFRTRARPVHTYVRRSDLESAGGTLQGRWGLWTVVEDISLVIQKSHRSGGDPPKTIQNPPPTMTRVINRPPQPVDTYPYRKLWFFMFL